MDVLIENKISEIFEWVEHINFECGDGWQWIILDMLREIDDLYFDMCREVDIEILQAKEKWGFLNVYHNSYDNDVNEVITRYTELSKLTCELCGDNGKPVNYNGWILNRCEDCKKGE